MGLLVSWLCKVYVLAQTGHYLLVQNLWAEHPRSVLYEEGTVDALMVSSGSKILGIHHWRLSLSYAQNLLDFSGNPLKPKSLPS